MEKLYKGNEDYVQEFSPQDYLRTYYAFNSSTVAENEILKFNLENLFQTFSAGGVTGDLLIDIGTGPTIYQLLSACEAFREIIVTDYTEQNLQELRKWLGGEPGAYDWSPVVQYVCELEGDRSKFPEKEARLRRTVSQVLHCDVTQAQPLAPAQVPPADCVLTLLALESACPDVASYRAAVRALVGLLRPGGHLVCMASLRSQFYRVGPKKFFGLYLEKETVEQALQDAGCRVLRCAFRPLCYSEGHSVNEGICFVVARKEP